MAPPSPTMRTGETMLDNLKSVIGGIIDDYKKTLITKRIQSMITKRIQSALKEENSEWSYPETIIEIPDSRPTPYLPSPKNADKRIDYVLAFEVDSRIKEKNDETKQRIGQTREIFVNNLVKKGFIIEEVPAQYRGVLQLTGII